MTTAKQYMEMADQAILHTYNRFPVVLERGEGMYLYDVEGKKYLDFGAGIAVFAFGYGNASFNEKVKAQVDRLIHTSNLFYNAPAAVAAERITKLSGMDRIFFTNSGTEAIEGAIKLARKYAYVKDGRTDHEIIAMNHSFHGRSIGALSVTGNTKYQDPFRPLIDGIRFADYNDLESVKKCISDRTCAIILETVQGEGGIYPADPDFLRALRSICDERGILLILDEIQCGMGRTGSMFAYERYGIQPDILTLAKALGCGIPVGAFLAKEQVAQAMVPGDHGTTYGGNPLAAAAANAVLDLFAETAVLANVRETGAYLYARLEELAAAYPCITGHRGVGLMQGIVFDIPVGSVISRALERGLIVLSAGGNVMRFVPPLIAGKEDVDRMIVLLKEAIEDAVRQN